SRYGSACFRIGWCTADEAAGATVLTRLHNEMGAKPVTPYFAVLWRNLGLRPRGEVMEFDDAAPSARRSAQREKTDPPCQGVKESFPRANGANNRAWPNSG